MKAFVLWGGDGGDGMELFAVITAISREKALQLLGSQDEGADFITIPTKGVANEVLRKCERSIWEYIALEETPLVTA